MTMSTHRVDPCGAYPRVTGCPWCHGSARFFEWGAMQGARYICQEDECGRFSVSIDWCECEDES